MRVCTRIPLLLIFTLFVCSLELHAGIWSQGTIHDTGFFNLNRNTHVVDDLGNSHIFYGGDHLYHSYKDSGGAWHQEVVDNSPLAGRYSVAALDQHGSYHVLYTSMHATAAYGSGEVPGVKYVVGNAGSWIIETTPIPLAAFGRTFFGGAKTLRVDSDGNVHFAYIVERTLYHAIKRVDGWTIESLKGFSNHRSDPGDVMLAIDSGNAVHISYFNQDTSELEHAHNRGGVWAFEVVNRDTAESSITTDFLALAIDSRDVVHVCYPLINTSGVEVYCSNNSSGSWEYELADDGLIDSTTDSVAGNFLSIVLDESDNIHLAYTLGVSNQSSYIRYAARNSSTWSHATYHFGPKPSTRLSNLRLMADGSVDLFMINEDPDDTSQIPIQLDHVSWDGSVWDRAQIATAGTSRVSVGYKSDIVTDKDGFSHVVYVLENSGYSNSDVYYANNSGGTWSVELLSSAISSDLEVIRPAITLDNNGFAHIVFAENTFNPVGTYYLTNASGVWTKELVGSEFTAVGKYSIKVDSTGVVHIAFISNGTQGRYKPWQLRYANNSTGSWDEVQLYEYPDADYTDISRHQAYESAVVELTIDSSNRVMIAFVRLEELMMASHSLAGWDVSLILNGEDLPYYYVDVLYKTSWHAPSLTFDNNNDLHIAYAGIECRGGSAISECFHAGLRYSRFESGEWHHQLVDPELYYVDYPHFETLFPTQPDIQITDSGKVYMAYYHYAYEHMRLAEVSDSCLITSTVIDSQLSLWDNSTRNYFLDPSLAILPDGNMAITYFDKANGRLKHAESQSGLEVNFCLSDPTNSQSTDVELTNRSLEPISATDFLLLGQNGSSILSETCSGQLLNPTSSCSIDTQFEDPLVPTISGILLATVSNPSIDDSNLVFVNIPGVTSEDDESGPPPAGQNSSGGGGGGATGIFLFLILFAYVFEVRRLRTMKR